MFKRFFALVLAFILVLFVAIINRTPVFENYSDYFELYIGSHSSNAQIVTVKKGDVFTFCGVKGQAFSTDKEGFDLNKFLSELDAKIVFEERVEQGVSYYAFSSKLKNKKKIAGKTVNVQIFIGNTVKVGTPIIYGSF